MGSDIIQANFENVSEANIEDVFEKTKTEVMGVLRKTIRPEFLNRVDEVIMYKPLLRSEINGIVEIQLAHLKQLLKKQNIEMEYTKHLVNWLAEVGFDPQFGARPLKRVIQRELVNGMSKKILSGDIGPGQSILIDVIDGQLFFEPKPKKESVEA